MASIKRFKKDLSYLTGEIISNCEYAAYFHGDKDGGQLAEIVAKAVEQHNAFHSAIMNAPKITFASKKSEIKNPDSVKARKQYFANLIKEVSDSSDALFLKISEICQKK